MRQTTSPAEFFLSDKPPSRRTLRTISKILRFGEYFIFIGIVLLATLLFPSFSLFLIATCWLLMLLLYTMIRRVLKKKRHWLMKEKSVWIHGMGGVISIALLYFTFRLFGYGIDESDPAGVYLLSLAPIALVSRYGRTQDWVFVLISAVLLQLVSRAWMSVFLFKNELMVSLIIFDVQIPFVSSNYIQLFTQAVFLFVVSVGIHYALRTRRMSIIQTQVQLGVFSELASNPDPQNSYVNTAELIHKLDNMPADNYPYVYIMLWDSKVNRLKVVGGAGKPREFWEGLEIQGGLGVTGRAIKTGKAVYEPDVRKLTVENYKSILGHEDVISELAIPIIFRDTKLGVLDVQSPIENEFDDKDIQFLSVIADGLGISIANTLLLDNKVSDAFMLSKKILESADSHSNIKFWFEDIVTNGFAYLDADRYVLFRLSPGTLYPLKPPLVRPSISSDHLNFNGAWPIDQKSYFWKLIRGWEPVFGLNLSEVIKSSKMADSWVREFSELYNISTVAFLPIGQYEPLAALFVCYEKDKIFTDLDKLALTTFMTVIEQSYRKVEVEPFEDRFVKLHNVVIPETQGLLGNLDRIVFEKEKPASVKNHADKVRDGIINLRKRIALASVGVGDYRYDPSSQTVKESLKNMAAMLNAGKAHGVDFDFDGIDKIKDEDPKFLQIIYELISEAMGNSVVHGRANSVQVRIEKDNLFISLEILDDGDGLQQGHEKDHPHGIYYWRRYLRKRFDVGLRIENRKDRGVRVAVRFPIRPVYQG